jgi:mannose-1-phosphate guanylyltransferase
VLLPVIMAGGSGSRLWPLSRSHYPKQFLSLLNDKTMLQNTALRVQSEAYTAPLIICGEEHRFTVAEQLRIGKIEHSGIILEPEGRNTAPAIALAALQAIKNGDDPLLLVLAADHAIQNQDEFLAAIDEAQQFASSGHLVTLGIVPQQPETGYGYIQMGSKLSHGQAKGFQVGHFREKPNLNTAKQYLASKEYLWNSGMFIFRASQYLEELKQYHPKILYACSQAMNNSSHDTDFIRPNKEEFIKCPDDSIDYAIMEKTSNAVVVPMDCGWSDVGSWSALWDISSKDEQGNTLKGDVITHATTNCFIQSDSKLVATVGLHNLVVIESDDAIMVADKNSVQDVKEIVTVLKQQQRPEAHTHRKVYRPWGHYDSIDQGARFQVKRIVVNPGNELSLQIHHHRAEHWIVVSGTAEVTKGNEVFLLSENESTYIPLGTKHRLKNPGTIPLEMIEVQSGSYLGEDDIVRFEDNYGRK